MNAELIAVGTELLLGDTINTDAAAVARLLSELGINVYWQTVVGDNRARLEQAVQLARTRADLIITTGGLGPTCDDLTKEVVAGAFGIPLTLNRAEEDRLRGLYRERGIYMTENHLQQVMLPRGCTVLQNDWGTAPACAFEADGCLVIMLPGPPSECRPMFYERAVPYLAHRWSASRCCAIVCARCSPRAGTGSSSRTASRSSASGRVRWSTSCAIS